MKKTIVTSLLVLTLSVSAFADMIVSPDKLPKSAQGFIKSSFKGASITQVEQDYEGFEVILNNGIKIEFAPNGSWKEIKSYQPLPKGILPAKAEKIVKAKYPESNILKIEKNWNGYEIKLDNRMELFVSGNGTLLGEQFDD